MQSYQFHIMHCAKSDSVLNAAGFSVRAASTNDPALLRSAFELPAYELPMDLWAKKPSRAEAPRRLARFAGGWTVHSSYLEKDTTNRDRSYFTHAVLDPSVDLLSVLKSWGTPGWATDYPAGATQKLPPPPPLSSGPFVSDAAVTMFLGNAPAPEVPLGVQTQPARLTGDRKALLEQFLNALLLATAQADGDRRRVYVHAEPGLVALLLYAAVRLLPGNVVRDLTFSTFEPAHRGLREFKLATVVGTYLGHASRGLDPEFGSQRGFALDTFHPQYSSPELFAPIPGIAEMVARAAAGRWEAPGDPIETSREGALEAFAAHDLGRCIAHWNVLARVQPPAQMVENLLDFLRQPKGVLERLPTGFRAWLRREAQDRLAGLPKEVLPLLRAGDPAEFEAIAGDVRIPAPWRATAVLVLLRKSESREVSAELRRRAATALAQAPPDVLACYCGMAFDNREKHPELWNELAAAMAPAALFDRLLAAGEAMPAKRWRTLFDEFQPYAANADPQWLTNGRRLHWLRVAENPALWQQLAAPLDGRFLAGDYSQDAAWGELQQGLQSLGNIAPIPDDVRHKVWSYSIVRAVIHDPNSRRQFGEEDVKRAFWAFGVPPPPPLPDSEPPPMAMPANPFDVAAEEPPADEAGDSTFRKRKLKARKPDRSMVPIVVGIGVLIASILVLLVAAWPKIQRMMK
jgi:hypothetical protein